MVRVAVLLAWLAAAAGCFTDGGYADGTGSSGASEAGASTSATTGSGGVASTGPGATTTAGTTGAPTTGGETGATTGSEMSTSAASVTGTTGPGLTGCEDADLRACFRFEALDGAAVDESAYGNHAAVTAATLASGVSGMGLDMGVSSRVVIPDAPSLSPTPAMSYAAWVNFRTLPAEGRTLIVDKDGQYAMVIRPEGMTCIQNGHTSIVQVPVVAGVWIHLACVHTETAQMLSYRDGALVGMDVGNPLAANGGPVVAIGNNSPLATDAEALDGVLDELKIWGRALTADEVAELANP